MIFSKDIYYEYNINISYIINKYVYDDVLWKNT